MIDNHNPGANPGALPSDIVRNILHALGLCLAAVRVYVTSRDLYENLKAKLRRKKR